MAAHMIPSAGTGRPDRGQGLLSWDMKSLRTVPRLPWALFFFFFFCPALLWIELHQLLRKHSHVWNFCQPSRRFGRTTGQTDNRTDFHGSLPGMKVAGIFFLSRIRKQACFNLLIIWRKHGHGQPWVLPTRQSGHE